MGFRDWGLGFRVCGLGFGVWCVGFGYWGLGFGVWGLGYGVWGSELKVWGLELRVCPVCVVEGCTPLEEQILDWSPYSIGERRSEHERDLLQGLRV